MVILLTNDDGYQAEGIEVLEKILLQAGHEVWVCAPADQRSAQSHAMTLRGKVKFVRFGDRHYHCSGTPADCILYGLSGGFLSIKPEVVISGINHGYNASTDILYSGTVGAASEAALRGIPAFAISARSDRVSGRFPFIEAATFLSLHLESFLPLCSSEVLININVPPHPSSSWRVGQIGQLDYFDVVERNSTVRSTSFDASSTKLGLAYGDAQEDSLVNIGDEVTFSLRGDVPPSIRATPLMTDYRILSEGDISVSPLLVHPCVHQSTCEALVALQQGR